MSVRQLGDYAMYISVDWSTQTYYWWTLHMFQISGNGWVWFGSCLGAVFLSSNVYLRHLIVNMFIGKKYIKKYSILIQFNIKVCLFYIPPQGLVNEL